MSRVVDLASALVRLWNVAQRDTGQSRVCLRVLLGLYNGQRFPFDLTDLRLLDSDLRRAAFDVMGADASGAMYGEVHDVLNRLSGLHDFGHRLEALAYDWRMPGRCTRPNLPQLSPARLTLRMPGDSPTAQLLAQPDGPVAMPVRPDAAAAATGAGPCSGA